MAGRYAIVITKDGFRTYDDFIEIRSGLDLNYQYGLIQMGNNDAKIIVQWLENNPKDPDAYIKVPDGTVVFRGKKDYDGVHLDRDNTSAPVLKRLPSRSLSQAPIPMLWNATIVPGQTLIIPIQKYQYILMTV